jgi:hypothetical protein
MLYFLLSCVFISSLQALCRRCPYSFRPFISGHSLKMCMNPGRVRTNPADGSDRNLTELQLSPFASFRLPPRVFPVFHTGPIGYIIASNLGLWALARPHHQAVGARRREPISGTLSSNDYMHLSGIVLQSTEKTSLAWLRVGRWRRPL